MIFRACTSEPYEEIERYTAETQQSHIFKAASWYPFALLVRNSIRHGIIRFHPYLQSKLPIRFRSRVITAADDGKKLDAFLQYEEAVHLVDAMSAFLKDELA